jgi:hypothetical protein
LFNRTIPTVQILLNGDPSHLELYAAKVPAGGDQGRPGTLLSPASPCRSSLHGPSRVLQPSPACLSRHALQRASSATSLAVPACPLQVADGYRPPMLATVPVGVREAIEVCWKGDADLRPNAAEVVERLTKLQESGEACHAYGAQGARHWPHATLTRQPSCRPLLRASGHPTLGQQNICAEQSECCLPLVCRRDSRDTRQGRGRGRVQLHRHVTSPPTGVSETQCLMEVEAPSEWPCPASRFLAAAAELQRQATCAPLLPCHAHPSNLLLDRTSCAPLFLFCCEGVAPLLAYHVSPHTCC